VSSDPEPILAPSSNRFVLFPIKYKTSWKMSKNQSSCFWVPEEIDLKNDKQHFEALGKGEKHFITMILAFFAGADGIVNENLLENFATEVQVPEIRHFYSFQAMMECVHAKTYSLLIDTYLAGNEEEKSRLFNSIETVPTIKRKAEWTLHWCDAKQPRFAERIIAFAAVEGIFFSASFCAIFHLKQRGILPGLCQANALISRDEGLHTNFACHVHSLLI